MGGSIANNNPLINSLRVASAGAAAQRRRLDVIAENLAGSLITGTKPGEEPYRRKMVMFGQKHDREQGIKKVTVKGIAVDKSEFPKEYDPGHPAADENGMVQKSNVNYHMEVRDSREAQRSYEANMQIVQSLRKAMEKHVNDIIGR